MIVDPASAVLFIPPGLKGFKQDLFERIGRKVGRVVRDDYNALGALPNDRVPIVGCTPELRPLVEQWMASRRRWIYWDRGYARRVFATWLPRGEGGGYYRWHVGSFQMQTIRDVPADRWDALTTKVWAWSPPIDGGGHILIAEPSPTYQRFHRIEGWTERTTEALKLRTKRPLRYRNKESKVPLEDDLHDAHALVTHGSNAAVEAVVMGCPVFVDRSSAAALVGRLDLNDIETPYRPDRSAWLRSLAYCQYNEAELVDGTLWRLLA